jgi:hypothetical protein
MFQRQPFTTREQGSSENRGIGATRAATLRHVPSTSAWRLAVPNSYSFTEQQKSIEPSIASRPFGHSRLESPSEGEPVRYNGMYSVVRNCQWLGQIGSAGLKFMTAIRRLVPLRHPCAADQSAALCRRIGARTRITAGRTCTGDRCQRLSHDQCTKHVGGR